jgi:hypothetical protein
MELRWLWAFGHYVGPYPIFWSGCLRQGVVHADFEKWLEALGNASLRERWNGFRANSFLV